MGYSWRGFSDYIYFDLYLVEAQKKIHRQKLERREGARRIQPNDSEARQNNTRSLYGTLGKIWWILSLSWKKYSRFEMAFMGRLFGLLLGLSRMVTRTVSGRVITILSMEFTSIN